MYSSVIKFFLLCLVSGSAMAHELLPTYPKIKNSYIPNVLTSSVTLWNGREDILYYQVDMFDMEWNPINFYATPSKLLKLDYLGRQKIDIYVGNADAKKEMYICTTSKILPGSRQKTVVSSKICSKIK